MNEYTPEYIAKAVRHYEKSKAAIRRYAQKNKERINKYNCERQKNIRRMAKLAMEANLQEKEKENSEKV